MCDPLWTNVQGSSTLNVGVTPDTGAAAVVSVVQTVNGSSSKTVLTGSNFPRSFPLGSGVGYRITVTGTSTGGAGTVAVVAEITGEDPRGPDGCTIEVDENHPVGIATIVAVSA
jgi:hypothetical protein